MSYHNDRIYYKSNNNIGLHIIYSMYSINNNNYKGNKVLR